MVRPLAEVILRTLMRRRIRNERRGYRGSISSEDSESDQRWAIYGVRLRGYSWPTARW